MSEQNENGSKPQPKGGSRLQPIFIWMAIITAIVSLYVLSEPPGSRAEPWTIKQVMDAMDEGTIVAETGIIKSEPTGGRRWTSISAEVSPGEGMEPVRVIAQGNLTDDNLEKLQASGYFKEKPASTLFTELLLTLLPIMLIIGVLYFLFVRQLRMAGRGAMNFGKSRAKMLTRDKDRVSFKDVAGCDESKEEVAEVVDFLKDPKKFQRIGGRIPKGVLLVGPPGTGKTLLARAVAGEADVPFFSISGSDFVEMFVGVGAARVRDMFDQGRKNAPCIIFIDEIDAVGRQRGAGLGGGNDEREQTLNSLLVEMDGFDGHEGVIIMAATNRADVLDNALLRPGRFDRQIVIDLPDLNGREEILKVHAKNIKLADSVELAVTARSTPGFSGADLANLLNEAALLAARYDKREVSQHEIDEARDKISYGRERRKLMDDEDKKMTAYHEAGHALVQAVIDDGKLPLHKVTIIPRGRALGLTMMTPKKDILGYSKSQLLNQICTAMAGRIGEELTTGDFSNGAASDIKMATNIARHMVCDWGMSDLGPIAYGENQDHIFLGKEITRNQNYSEESARRIDAAIKEIVESQFERATGIIKEHKESLELIAQALLEYETIEGKHVHEIMDHGEIRSPIISMDTHTVIQHEKPDEKPEAAEKHGDELGPGAAPAPA